MVRLFIFLAFFNLFSCKQSTSGGTSSLNVTIDITSNATISSYPHTIDYYTPSNATSALIILHGGGGKKEGLAYNLGIKTDDTTSSYELQTSAQEWMKNNKVMLVFPQGQKVAPLSWTWTNYVMNSGEDDVAFLQDLVSDIKANHSKITKVYLAGHSNGGMMANRMWCESPDTFDAYGALAGPASTQLASGGAHPCNPSIVKPFISIVGNSDTILQSTGHMSDAQWTIALYNSSNPAWVNSTVINDINQHTTRVTKRCSASVGAPVTNGQLTTYSDCSDSVKLIVVAQTTINSQASGGDHCLLDLSSNCVTTLKGQNDLDYKSALFNFLKNY